MNTFDEMIACIQAHKEGKKLQYSVGSRTSWVDVVGTPCFDFIHHDYRIKPTPTLRPWKPEEVPVGARMRNKDTKNIYLLTGVMMRGYFFLCGSDRYEWKAFESYEYSLDHGKTWLPCGVEV